MATVYAPICYPPLPVLGFKLSDSGGRARLALVGSVRDCDPDRVVLKKVVLSG
jgi:pre-rRNA-processing protein TSR1